MSLRRGSWCSKRMDRVSLLFLLRFTADAGFHAPGAGWKIKMDPSLAVFHWMCFSKRTKLFSYTPLKTNHGHNTNLVTFGLKR